ncbi:MAG: hypothetical protein ACI8XO_003794 [Verrucomicrobiales bacterium]|jgi:hypothetical protein
MKGNTPSCENPDRGSAQLARSIHANPEVTYEVSSSVDMTAWTVELSDIPAVGPSTSRDVSITPGDAMFFRVRAFR